MVFANNADPVTHLEESSTYVIKFRPFMRGSFIMCQSVCYVAFECRRSNPIHLRFPDFAGKLTARSLDFIMRYT